MSSPIIDAMSRPTISRVVLCAVLVYASARSAPSQSAPATQTALAYLSKAEAEAILGEPAEKRGDYTEECRSGLLQNSGGGTRKIVTLDAWFSPDLAQQWSNVLKDLPTPTTTVVPLSGLGDAAILMTIPGYSASVYAFKGGTIQVRTVVVGFSDDFNQKTAKSLAVKPLGGVAGTGYHYTPPPRSPSRRKQRALRDSQGSRRSR